MTSFVLCYWTDIPFSLPQRFLNSMIQTLSSVRSKKDTAERDDKLIKWTFNEVRFEWTLVRSSDDCWKKWERFFTKHVKGELICPELGHQIKDTPNFKSNMKIIAPLTKNWFKCVESLTEREIDKLVTYLLNEKTDDDKPIPIYPKVIPFTVKGASKSRSILSALEWGNRKRTKRHVIGEFNRYTKGEFGLIETTAVKGLDEAHDVHRKNWRTFKKVHMISSKTMANVVESAGEKFFNNFEGRNRLDKGFLPAPFIESIRAVVETKSEDALTTDVGACILVKNEFTTPGGEVVKKGNFTTVGDMQKGDIREKTNSEWVAFIDFRNVEGVVPGSDVEHPFWESFVKKLEAFKIPRWSETPVWIWIADDSRKEQVQELYKRKLKTTHLKPVEAYYHPDAMEGFRCEKKVKGNVVTIYYIVKEQWVVPALTNVFRCSKLKVYTEGKYRYYTGELRMETYIRILQEVSGAFRSVFNIYGGRKLMLACQVNILTRFIEIYRFST